MGSIKLAIIGAGPSSFYVASRLLSLLPRASHPDLRIHMYDRLWAPHGLVRYGVAPDHPEVKNCTHKFDATAEDPRLRFFGNVNIGHGSPFSHAKRFQLSHLLPHYTHLLIASGCTEPISHPALPFSSYCLPALNLVHWYTRHPSSPHIGSLSRIRHVSLIGQGNVSLDVARMLLTPPSELAKFDVPTHVLEALERSSVEHVSIIGRRGPRQAAFTTKELREMMNLSEAAMVPLDPALLKSAADGPEPLTRQQSRTLQLLEKGSKNQFGTTRKTWSLDFFRSPMRLDIPEGADQDSASIRPSAELTLAHTRLDERARAIATDDESKLSTSLVVTSLGHRSEPSTAWYDESLGHVSTVGGRVVDKSGRTVRNVYASGWAAMGAKGVLASTMLDAYAVTDTILRDAFPEQDVVTMNTGENDVVANLRREVGEEVERDFVHVLPKRISGEAPPSEIEAACKGGEIFDYADWKAINAEEVRRGEAKGKERERMSFEDAQSFLKSNRPQKV